MALQCVVSLTAFERDLFHSILSNTNQQPGLQEADSAGVAPDQLSYMSKRLFDQWEWVRCVKEAITECCNAKKREEYNNDLRRLEALFNHTLQYSPEHGIRSSRTETLKQDNPFLFASLAVLDVKTVNFVSNPVDKRYWDLLTRLHIHCPKLMGEVVLTDSSLREHTEQIQQSKRLSTTGRPFNLWHVLRMFQLNIRRPDNIESINKILLEREVFKTKYDQIIGTDLFLKKEEKTSQAISVQNLQTEELHRDESHPNESLERLINAIANLSDSASDDDDSFSDRRLDARPESAANVDSDEDAMETNKFIDAFYQTDDEDVNGGDEDYTLRDAMRLEYRLIFSRIVNPGFHVEFIPFSEFSNVIRLPYASREEWLGTWPIPDSMLCFHQLFTEEQVFEYCLMRKWELPNQRQDGGVAFVLTPLDDSGFLDDLQNYWEVWNDCKITQGPQDQLLLVQSFPGHLFRDICAKRDQNAARKYFYRLAYDHHLGIDSSVILKSLLGSAWRHDFDNLLHYIPREQFVSISKQRLGAGAHGCVHAAVWQRPSTALNRDYTNPARSQKVVLKYFFDFLTAQDQTKGSFFKELQNTHSALSGLDTGCIKFYGITELSLDDIDLVQMHHPGRPMDRFNTPGKVLCLVFGHAEGGNVLNFIDRYFSSSQGLSESERWLRIVVTFDMLFNGLITLHDREFIHRDLHFNNTLVRDTVYESETPANEVIRNCVLADFGESKMLTDENRMTEIVVEVAQGSASFLAGEFKPPEVRGKVGWSMKGDIYSMGIMMKKVIDRERERALNETKDSKEPIPSTTPVPSSSINSRRQPQTKKQEPFRVPRKVWQLLESCTQEDPQLRPVARKVVIMLEKISHDIERDRCEWIELGAAEHSDDRDGEGYDENPF